MRLQSIVLLSSVAVVAWGAVAPPTKVLEARDTDSQPGIPACSTAAADPQPTRLVCGKEGRLYNPQPIMKAVVTADQTECRDTCLNNDQCIAFSFNTNNSKCTLYPKAIVKQFFSRGDTGRFFYNRACYKITCTCPNDRTLCTGPYCANLNSDPSNCGACGNICPPDQTCKGGDCVTTVCYNVIDCDNGIFGSDTDCGSANCYCADVEGSSDSGLCTTNGSCGADKQCDTSADCKDGYFCSFKTCCGFNICNRYLAPQCGNPANGKQIFKHPSSKPKHDNKKGI